MNKLGRRLMLLAACACAGAATLAAPATAPAKTKVIGQVSHHTDGTLFDIAYVESRWVKSPKEGSIIVRIDAVTDDPAEQNLIYGSGLMECYQKGKLLAGGADRDHVAPPIIYKTGYPFGVKKPKRCRVNVSSNFDPVPTRQIWEPLPIGTITITILWKK